MGKGDGVLLRLSVAAATESRQAFLSHVEMLPPTVVATTKVVTGWVWLAQVVGIVMAVGIFPVLGVKLLAGFPSVGAVVGGAFGCGLGALSWVGGNFIKAGVHQRALRSQQPPLGDAQGSESSSTVVPLLME